MATCKDCLHVEVCKDYAINYLKGTPIEALEKEVGDYPCCRFQDRSLFVELPCKVGDFYYTIQQQCTERGFYDKPKDTDIMDCEFCCDSDGKCDRSYYIKENKFHSILQIVEYCERYILSDKSKKYRKIFHIKEEVEQALKNIGDKNA